MWDRRTVCGSLEKIAHSDFDLPMTAIALTGRYLPFVCGPPVLTCVCLGALDMPGTAFWMRFVSPFVRPGTERAHDKTRRSPPPRLIFVKIPDAERKTVGFLHGVYHTPLSQKMQD